jgi:hypothetical protein
MHTCELSNFKQETPTFCSSHIFKDFSLNKRYFISLFLMSELSSFFIANSKISLFLKKNLPLDHQKKFTCFEMSCFNPWAGWKSLLCYVVDCKEKGETNLSWLYYIYPFAMTFHYWWSVRLRHKCRQNTFRENVTTNIN